jgi:hypothetical protein
MKRYLVFEDYISEKQDNSFDNDIDNLMNWILNIDDTIKYNIVDKDKREIRIETDEMTLASDILKKINNDKSKFSVKSAEVVDYNDLIIIFKSPEEERKEQKEIEKERKEKEKDKDIMMGLPPEDGSYGKDEIPA